VDQLGGPGAGALGKVIPLQQDDRQAPRSGIQGDSQTSRPAADDQHIELCRGGKPIQGI
jgi:hypothetical protein